MGDVSDGRSFGGRGSFFHEPLRCLLAIGGLSSINNSFMKTKERGLYKLIFSLAYVYLAFTSPAQQPSSAMRPEKDLPIVRPTRLFDDTGILPAQYAPLVQPAPLPISRPSSGSDVQPRLYLQAANVRFKDVEESANLGTVDTLEASELSIRLMHLATSSDRLVQADLIEQAADQLLEGLIQAPTHLGLLERMARLYGMLGQSLKSDLYWETLVILHPENADYTWNRLVNLYRLGTPDEVWPHVREALRLHQTDERIRLLAFLHSVHNPEGSPGTRSIGFVPVPTLAGLFRILARHERYFSEIFGPDAWKEAVLELVEGPGRTPMLRTVPGAAGRFAAPDTADPAVWRESLMDAASLLARCEGALSQHRVEELGRSLDALWIMGIRPLALRWYRVRWMLWNGRKDNAVDEAMRMSTDFRNDPGILARVGYVLLEAGEAVRALPILERSSQLDENDPLTRFLSAGAYALANQPDIALTRWEEFRHLQPNAWRDWLRGDAPHQRALRQLTNTP